MNIQIMAVDDSPFTLSLIKQTIGMDYEVLLIEGPQAAIGALSKPDVRLPDLIILDINMPAMNGFEFFEWLKQQPRAQGVPVIFLSSADRNSNEIKAIESGAMDYISKPFSPNHLKKRVDLYISLLLAKKEVEIKNQRLKEHSKHLKEIVNEKTKELLELRDALIYSFGDMIESRDGGTGGHIKRTASYIEALATACAEMSIYQDQLTPDTIRYIVKSASLHDIGKISITDTILLKPDKLSAEEFEIMKTHCILGYQILEKIAQDIPFSKELEVGMEMALSHHEKWNGTGYPKGLAGQNIPLSGRLMAVADVYDALVTERPYKSMLSHPQAVQIIVQDSGKHFDPNLIRVFLAINKQFQQIATQYI